MEGYYSDILSSTAEFDDYMLDDDVTQTRIVVDGLVTFDIMEVMSFL